MDQITTSDGSSAGKEALLLRIEELRSSVGLLGLGDQQLVEYLVGEVQHLINRVQSGRTLSPSEDEELRVRNCTVELFKLFYAICLCT